MSPPRVSYNVLTRAPIMPENKFKNLVKQLIRGGEQDLDTIVAELVQEQGFQRIEAIQMFFDTRDLADQYLKPSVNGRSHPSKIRTDSEELYQPEGSCFYNICLLGGDYNRIARLLGRTPPMEYDDFIELTKSLMERHDYDLRKTVSDLCLTHGFQRVIFEGHARFGIVVYDLDEHPEIYINLWD